MAKFCTRCGRPLQEGEVCSCSTGFTPPKFDVNFNPAATKGFIESIKNRMGIGNPELNSGDAYESGKQIIPDCVKANESEIPVKQYNVATLQSRIFGIPYAKAKGRLQVTNKRVIFRAPGRCFAGRTTLQHEFSIDEIAGLEARREYVFNAGDVLIGLLAALLGGFVITWLTMKICGGSLVRRDTVSLILMTLLFGIAGCVPFFTLKRKWLLKLLCLGGSATPLLIVGKLLSMIGEYRWADAFWGGLFTFLGWVAVVLSVFSLIVYAIRPNLVLLIKTKGTPEAIDIKRKKTRLFGAANDKEDHTGYAEVFPAEDAEKCIREINAMINDIQKLGDFGIEKWKV